MCAEQGVVLYGDLASEEQPPFTVSVNAGIMIGNGEALASRPIRDTTFCENDILYEGLAKMINTSIEPNASYPVRVPKSDKRRAVCSYAETYFGGWLDGIVDRRNVGGRVFVAKKKAVAIQKAIGLSGEFGTGTSLLLEDLAVNPGIILPAGSIVFMPCKSDQFATFKDETEVVQLDQVVGASYLRMSGLPMSDEAWHEYFSTAPLAVPRHRSIRHIPERTANLHLMVARKIIEKFVASDVQQSRLQTA